MDHLFTRQSVIRSGDIACTAPWILRVHFDGNVAVIHGADHSCQRGVDGHREPAIAFRNQLIGFDGVTHGNNR